MKISLMKIPLSHLSYLTNTPYIPELNIVRDFIFTIFSLIQGFSRKIYIISKSVKKL